MASINSLLNDNIWTFAMTRVKYGTGASTEVGYDVKAFGVRKVLVVTDKYIKAAGLVDIVVKSLEDVGLEVEVWDQAEPEPSIDSMAQGAEFAAKVKPEGFVAVGGGSVMDTMKVMNLIYTHGGEILDYVAPPTGKGKPVPGPLKPQIAIPTTAGTGSETTPTAVISLPKEELKVGISHHWIRPHMAILDPLMTVTCPPKVTASSGIDALSHAIGAYTTRKYYQRPRPETPDKRPVYGGANPLTDIFAQEAIRLIGKYLRRAVYQPYDIEARSGMLLAAFYAGAAFSNAGLLVDHALAYPVGAEYHTPHGLTIAPSSQQPWSLVYQATTRGSLRLPSS